MFVQGMWQTFFGINVALFMMLTGYLNLNKTVCRKYYCGGVRVIVSYLIISLVTIAFRTWYLEDTKSVWQWMNQVGDFSAIPYAWYIKMWIGLFLLTPFLNAMWRGLESKCARQVLIATLFLLSAPSDLLNRYGMTLWPDYWEQAAYPLMFFFSGAYIKTYQPMVKRWKIAAAAVAICMINPIVTMAVAHGHTYVQITGDTNGLFIAPLAVMVFLLLYRIDVKNEVVKATLRKVSVLSLDMYLFSWICDQFYYPLFMKNWYVDQGEFGCFFFIIVPLVLATAFGMAWMKQLVIRV